MEVLDGPQTLSRRAAMSTYEPLLTGLEWQVLDDLRAGVGSRRHRRPLSPDPPPGVVHEDKSLYVFSTRRPLGGMPGHTLECPKAPRRDDR